jgi:hypothetical protein
MFAWFYPPSKHQKPKQNRRKKSADSSVVPDIHLHIPPKNRQSVLPMQILLQTDCGKNKANMGATKSITLLFIHVWGK